MDLWLANFSVVSQIRLMPHYHHQVQQVVEFMRLVSIAVVASAAGLQTGFNPSACLICWLPTQSLRRKGLLQ